jgi:hypothetical protein
MYWYSDWHKIHKFNVLLNLLTALTVIFTSLALLVQVFVFSRTEEDSQVTIYSTIFTNLINDTITDFQQYPQMNYYYNQIFNADPVTIKPVKRNYILEQQLTYLIVSRISNVIFYLDNSSGLNDITRANEKLAFEQKLDDFVAFLKKSPIFLQNYKKITPIMSDYIKEYIQTKYNIQYDKVQ